MLTLAILVSCFMAYVDCDGSGDSSGDSGDDDSFELPPNNNDLTYHRCTATSASWTYSDPDAAPDSIYYESSYNYHEFTEDDCVGGLPPVSSGNTDNKQCIAAFSALDPICENLRIHYNGETLVLVQSSSNPDFIIHGPGIAFRCAAGQSDDISLDRDNIFWRVEYICGDYLTSSNIDCVDSSSSSSSEESCSISFTECNQFKFGPGNFADDGNKTYYIEYTDSSCNNGVPNGDNCIAGMSYGFMSASTAECNWRVLSPDESSVYPGVAWDIGDDKPASTPRARSRSGYVCGDFDSFGFEQTTCSYIGKGTQDVTNDNVFYYLFNDNDCTNNAPQGDCIAWLRKRQQCFNNAYGFIALHEDEEYLLPSNTQIQGPGIVWKTLNDDSCDEDGQFVVDYLCS